MSDPIYGFEHREANGNTIRENAVLAGLGDPLNPTSASSSGPVSVGGPAQRIGKSPPLWVSLPIWGGLIWAFIHVPFMTQGHWSGPIGFGAITLALIITSSSLRAFAMGCLLPFTVFGTFVVYQGTKIHFPQAHQSAAMHRVSRTPDKRAHLHHHSTR